MLSTDVKSYYASIDYLMLPDQLTLHIKGNSPILRPIHGRILARWARVAATGFDLRRFSSGRRFVSSVATKGQS